MTRRAAPGEAHRWVLAAITSATDGCLLWPFKSQIKGYPMVRWQGRTTLAHRVVLESVKGPPPDGMEALHSCDVSLCCNPRHLRWGTRPENVAEQRARGRMGGWFQPTRPVLTEDDVRAIRVSVESVSSLARRYGVTRPTIRAARDRRTWKGVA